MYPPANFGDPSAVGAEPPQDDGTGKVLRVGAGMLALVLLIGLAFRQVDLLALVTQCSGLVGPAVAADTQPLRWLKAADYATLDQHYSSLQQQFDSGELSDQQLYGEFRALYQDNPGNGHSFDAWAAAYPHSYAARVAQGAYYYRMAWAVRGERFVSQTAPLRLLLMQLYLQKASAILADSLLLDPKPYLSDLYLLNIAMLHGTHEQARHWLDAGSALDPNNTLLRLRYLMTLQPRWGGSIEEMRAFVDECARAQVAPVTLARMKWQLAEEEIYVAGTHVNPELAHSLWTELVNEAHAAGAATPPVALAALARSNWELGRRAEADELLAQIDEHQLHDAWALSQMAYIYINEQRMPQAWGVVQKAARLGDAWSQMSVGLTLIRGCPELNLPPNRAAGLPWIERAAAQGDPEAAAYLAR